jgi:predicted nucleotidyltransferase
MINFLWARIMSKTLSAKPEPKDQISEDLCKRIVDFASRHVDIVAIYIFGSVATAKNRSGSDIDVAIMVRGQVKGMERVQLETSFSNFMEKDVDLIIFGEATPLLQHQILKYGCLIYERDPKERMGQEIAARREYLDTTFLYRVIEDYP